MSKNKLAIVIAIIILAVVVLAIMSVGNKSALEGSPTPSVSVATSANPSGSTGNKTINPAQQAYQVLVQQYEGKRVQFDKNCQAIPPNLTFKNGVKILFDNRSGDARTITVDGTQYSFPGYGYRVLTLSSRALPHVVYLSCGSAVNVGTITLQN